MYQHFVRRLGQACMKLGLPHVTPHGLRSYFVTQARQSGLTDAEIAQLIGDKTGPALIAQVYGDGATGSSSRGGQEDKANIKDPPR